MTDETWLAALDHELAARGLGTAERVDAVAEAETFLREAGGGALDQFGPPASYADTVAAALASPDANRLRAGSWRDTVPAGPGGQVASLLQARGIVKSYRSGPVLNGIDLDVGRGEIVALIGSNGVGKSTLLRVLAGLEAPERGTVQRTGTVGYVPQSGGLDPYLRPTEHFALFGSAHGLTAEAARHEGQRLARELGWDAAGAPLAGELSGGTRQKLSVVLALLGDPDVLLLDEPYQGMDPDSARRFWELVWAWGDAGRAAVVSSHDSGVLQRASSVVELHIGGPA